MGIIVLVCFLIGILSICYFIWFFSKKIKSKINKTEYKFEAEFPYDFYKEKPLTFLIVGVIIILLTLFAFSPSIMTIIFPNDLRYKPEGTYCYYVIEKNNEAHPAKIEKVSYEDDAGEDYYGNSKTETHINFNLLELYIGNESYEFYDDPQEIFTDDFSNITYIEETDEQEIEKEFSIKLTNDVAYCPSFGKGETKIDYLELTLEILVLVSEISMYIITIYMCRKKNNNSIEIL